MKRVVGLFAGALGVATSGCGSPPPAEAARPPAAEAPKLQVVEADAPFIVDWDAPQIASLNTALRAPSAGGIVVSYQRNVMRILPDCHLAGTYVPSAIGMYRGLLQVRRADSAGRTAGTRNEALQQTATSANVAQGAVLDYRFVIVGRHYLTGHRQNPTLRDLSSRSAEGCRDATHFVRAGLIGAFERTGGVDPNAPLPVGAPLPKDGKAPLHGGDFTACMMAGSASSPSCSAFVKIEIVAISEAPASDSAPPAVTSVPTAAPLVVPTAAPQIVIPKPGDLQKPAVSAPAATNTASPIAAPTSTNAPQIAIPKPPPSADPKAPENKAPDLKTPENKAPENKAP